jgi:formamidopyrimidine-DNA glycosylase
MPELPEVETTRRGLEPHVVGRSIAALEVREPRLRWPVAGSVDAKLRGRTIVSVARRGKYLLFDIGAGALLVHLGMSGSLRFLPEPPDPGRHDHVDLRFAGGGCVRFNDPRRFGSMVFSAAPHDHPLLRHLGPEPLGDAFTGDYLWGACRGRRVAIKQHIMNGTVVVGVGNIYANEALHGAGIHPLRAAGRVSRERIGLLVDGIRAVLGAALESGGTTLRDYVGSDGNPGYFKLSLAVYDRAGKPCRRCGEAVRKRVIGQRASYYCADCQR